MSISTFFFCCCCCHVALLKENNLTTLVNFTLLWQKKKNISYKQIPNTDSLHFWKTKFEYPRVMGQIKRLETSFTLKNVTAKENLRSFRQGDLALLSGLANLQNIIHFSSKPFFRTSKIQEPQMKVFKSSNLQV